LQDLTGALADDVHDSRIVGDATESWLQELRLWETPGQQQGFGVLEGGIEGQLIETYLKQESLRELNGLRDGLHKGGHAREFGSRRIIEGDGGRTSSPVLVTESFASGVGDFDLVQRGLKARKLGSCGEDELLRVGREGEAALIRFGSGIVGRRI
jgi:hypothetical protein